MRFYDAIIKARREIKKEIEYAKKVLRDYQHDETQLNLPMKYMKFNHEMCHYICKHCLYGAVWQEKPDCRLNKYKECVKIINTDKCKFEEVK